MNNRTKVESMGPMTATITDPATRRAWVAAAEHDRPWETP